MGRLNLSPSAIAVLLSALIAAALPLLILVLTVPISDPDVGRFAKLHLRPAFGARVALTFAYFPAVIALHYFIRPEQQPARDWYFVGFALFLVGNGIDAVYRAFQYLVVHGLWAPEVLAAGIESVAAAKIQSFNEIGPAIGLSFAWFFAVGRFLMGAALVAAGGRLRLLCGLAIMLNGLWNLATILSVWPPLNWLGAIGSYYIWPWLIAIVIAGLLGWQMERQRARPAP